MSIRKPVSRIWFALFALVICLTSSAFAGQITILSTSYDAADGRNSGAQIKVVTKSGTN
jgi:hypothetical protein